MLALLLVGVAGSAAAWQLPSAGVRPAWSWSGTWSTLWGKMVLVQTGDDTVTGTYDGLLNGKKVRAPGTVSGKANPKYYNRFTGGWKEGPGACQSGWIELSSDGTDFSGHWRYGSGCTDRGTYQIVGTRKALPPPTTTTAPTTTTKPTTAPKPPPPSGSGAIAGTVTDGYGDPVPQAYVRAVSDAGVKEAITTEKGAYRITGLPVKRAYRIEVWLQLMTSLENRPFFRIHYGTATSNTVRAATKAFTLTAAGARVDVNFARTDQLQPSLSAPAPQARLGELAVIYFHAAQAVYGASTLVADPSTVLKPFDVVAFAGAGDGVWWEGPLTSPKSTWGRPERIVVQVDASGYSDWGRPKNREWHEYGHQFLANLFTRQPGYQGKKNHQGYCVNTRSTDAWTEGFAEFYAMLVGKVTGEKAQLERYPFGANVASADLEVDWKAWSGKMEEFAVAGLLLDLVDGPGWYGGPDDDAVQVAPAKLIALIRKGASAKAEGNGHIFDLVDLYRNLAVQKIGAGDANKNGRPDLNDLFIAHGFFANKDDDETYQPGEAIAYTDHGQTGKYVCNRVSPRRDVPDQPGSFVRFQAVEPSGKPVAGVSFKVAISYSPPYTRFAHSDTVPAPANGRLYLTLAPTGARATIVATAPGYKPSQPLVLDSKTYWDKLSLKANVPLLAHTFTLVPLKPGPPTTTTTRTTTTTPKPPTTTTTARDTVPPQVQALPSSGKAGSKIELRFTSSDDSGQTREHVTVYHDQTLIAEGSTQLSASVAGKVYTIGWNAPADITEPLRFCVQAWDPSGNASAISCAAITLT